VQEAIEKTAHVQPAIFVNKEMALVPEKNAKGIDKYRTDLTKIWQFGYFNQVMTGFEHQVASHMICEDKLYQIYL
jgi:hypothetical protein